MLKGQDGRCCCVGSAWGNISVHRLVCAYVFAAVMLVGGAQTAWSQPAATSRQAPPEQAATQATDAGSTVTWMAGAAFASQFIWRGFVLADAPCVQPTASVSLGGVTVTSWANLITTGTSQGWSEHDLFVDYTREAGAWQFSAGYINYYFPTEHDAHFSHEFYASVGYSGPLNPSVGVFYDVLAGDGTYVSAGISQTFPLGKSRWTATPAATLGYNDHQWVDGSGWSDLNLGVTLALPPGSHVDVEGSFNYSKSLHAEWFPSRAYVSVSLTVH